MRLLFAICILDIRFVLVFGPFFGSLLWRILNDFEDNLGRFLVF
jgi:hypothetical protein